MSFGGSKPKLPAPPPPIAVEKQVESDIRKTRDDRRKKAIAQFGFPGTQKTGSLGLAGPAPVGGKTLLGT